MPTRRDAQGVRRELRGGSALPRGIVSDPRTCLSPRICLPRVIGAMRSDLSPRARGPKHPPHAVHSPAPTLSREVDSPSLAHRENNRLIPAFPCLLSHARHQTGADDTEAQSFGKVAPCLLRFGGAARAPRRPAATRRMRQRRRRTSSSRTSAALRLCGARRGGAAALRLGGSVARRLGSVARRARRPGISLF